MNEPTIANYQKVCATLLGSIFGAIMGVRRTAPNAKERVRAHMVLTIETLSTGADFHPDITKLLLDIVDVLMSDFDVHSGEIYQVIDAARTMDDAKEIANLGIVAGKRSAKRAREQREKGES
jgi:hypothetical protein